MSSCRLSDQIVGSRTRKGPFLRLDVFEIVRQRRVVEPVDEQASRFFFEGGGILALHPVRLRRVLRSSQPNPVGISDIRQEHLRPDLARAEAGLIEEDLPAEVVRHAGAFFGPRLILPRIADKDALNLWF